MKKKSGAHPNGAGTAETVKKPALPGFFNKGRRKVTLRIPQPGYAQSVFFS